MPVVVCYISGHGFGHASRLMEVANALCGLRPDVQLVVRAPTPRWFLDLNLRGRFSHFECRLDIGAVQSDSLSVDPEATLVGYSALDARKDALVTAEVAALRGLRPALVFADIPPLAFDVADRLGVPAVGMANFSWDWIYEDYVQSFPAYEPLVDGIRASYALSALLLRLPMHGDLSAFPKIRDVPLVARVATLSRAEVCERLRLPADRRLVLLSFGGIGVELEREKPKSPEEAFFLTNQTPGAAAPPSWCEAVRTSTMREAGVRYEDLVHACDVVMTKPGYGIVAECIANSTSIVYTPRGRFIEYPYLVAGIEEHLPHAEISNEDLRAGSWRSALASVFTALPPEPLPPDGVSGSRMAAEALVEFLGRG